MISEELEETEWKVKAWKQTIKIIPLEQEEMLEVLEKEIQEGIL